jgi:ribosomal protein L2
MSCLLKEIPFNFIISNITNFLIQKITFTKSSGTFSKKQKTKKTKKLIQIILPSQQLIFLPQNSTAFIGKNYNFNSNKLVEGK